MTTLKIHGPVLLFLLVIVFAAFGSLLTTPLWNPVDAQILTEAHEMAKDPGRMFEHIGFYFSQPLLQLFFLAEYQVFGIDPTGYLAVNLVFHALNSFVIYMLVNMLFPRRYLAIVAAILFAFSVGSYGKVFMSVRQLEALLLANLHLFILYFFIRNDFRGNGALRSPFFVMALLLFVMTGLTKSTSLSLVGCLVAYKLFFRADRGLRAVLSPDIIVLVVVAVLYHQAAQAWGYREPTVFDGSGPVQFYTWMSLKNFFRYLTLMFFPMQTSRLIETVPLWVQWAFEARFYIRVFLALSVVSFSFFGFVFGSRAIRFFIAWTFITVLPFTSQTASGAWLNLSHLYLTSIGFCVILAAGTVGTSNLLRRAGWKRFIPYLVPVAFIVISLGLTSRFIERNKERAHRPEAVAMREELARCCAPGAEESGG